MVNKFFIAIILIMSFCASTFLLKATAQYYNQNCSADKENVLIILDSSESMSDKINGETKIAVAKRAVNKVLNELPQNVSVGLRVYGHKTGFLGLDACSASELKVPIGVNNKYRISNELLKIHPVGMTPIYYSLHQAVNRDFGNLCGKKRIILISDGMETCSNSPCDYAIDLVRNKISIKIDVIGFNLTDPITESQLKCVALSTKGRFYRANDADELSKGLSSSINSSKEVWGKLINQP